MSVCESEVQLRYIIMHEISHGQDYYKIFTILFTPPIVGVWINIICTIINHNENTLVVESVISWLLKLIYTSISPISYATRWGLSMYTNTCTHALFMFIRSSDYHNHNDVIVRLPRLPSGLPRGIQTDRWKVTNSWEPFCLISSPQNDYSETTSHTLTPDMYMYSQYPGHP